MTLPPQRLGDKGQQYEARYREDGGPAQTIGWATTAEAAEKMCAAWRLRGAGVEAWWVDRHEKGYTRDE